MLVCYLFLIQADFRIMCENAMIYNKPETIYHKAARKLLHSGMKILSQVRNQFRQRHQLHKIVLLVCCDENLVGL